MATPPQPPGQPPCPSLQDFQFLSPVPAPESSSSPTPSQSQPSSPSATQVLSHSPQFIVSHQTPIERFQFLLQTCTALINTHGPYTLRNHVFRRAPTASSRPLTSVQVAHSLTCAQDALSYQQPPGLANDDLQVFVSLWATTLQVLSSILADHLPLSLLGWGVLGLAAGYIDPHPTPVSIATLQSRKARLRTALLELPSLEDEHVRRNREAVLLQPAQKVHGLKRTNREVHINAMMLLHIMQTGGENGNGEWEGVRWFHGVSVVNGWLGALRLG